MAAECTFKECHAILKHTKANVLIIDQKKDIKENFLSWIIKTSYSEFQNQQENSFGLDVVIPIEGVPIPFGLNSSTSEEDYERLQQYIQEGRVVNFSHNEAKLIVSRMVDPEVYRKWGMCMDRMIECVSESNYGLHYEANYRQNEIMIRIWYVPFNPHDPWPKIKSNMYVPSVAKCMHDCIDTSTVFDRELTVVINRVSSGDGTIIVNTDKGSVQVPIVPLIEEIHETEIQSAIEEFIIQRLIAAGANLESYNSDGIFRGRAHVFLENFQANKGKISFIVKFERNITVKIKIIHHTHTVNIDSDSQMGVNFDLASTELSSLLFCADEKIKLCFGIKELCITAQEVGEIILNQFQESKTYKAINTNPEPINNLN